MFLALFALSISVSRPRIQAQTNANGIACTMCESIVSYVEQIMVDAKTEAEVANLVKKLCAKFPAPYNTLCDTLVDQYVPQIMNWLEQGLEKAQVCKKLGFCAKTSRQANGFKANAFTCTLCQTIVKMVEEVMVDTKVEAEVQQLVGKVCLKFPAPYDTLCQSLVGQFIPTIMEFLEQGLEKLDVCRKIKMCPQVAPTANKFRVAGPITCTLCTTIVSYAEQALIDQKTEAEVANLLKKVCAKFPAPYNTLCNTLVEQYVPQIMSWIEQGIEKVEICKKLKFCTDGKVLRAANGWQPSALSCAVCQTIIKYLEESMVSTPFVEQVEFLINKLCAKLPQPYDALCTQTVNEYIPYILQLLEQGVEKLDICSRIRMCQKAAANGRHHHGHHHHHARRANGFMTNGFACNICKTIVEKVIEIVQSTTVESEVIAKVELVCAKFPAPYNVLCNTLVEQYVPQMIDWATQGLEKAEICKRIKLCTDGNKKVVLYTTNGFKANAISCTICQTIITYVEQIMVDTKVEAAIQEQIGKLCAKFPSPYNTLCDSLVGQYIPMIMQWAEQGLEKVEICKKIKLCA